MALEWFSETANVPEGLILTDSLSSIQLIKNSNSKKHNVYIYKIQRLLEEIKNQNKVIAICWIPSHRGIPGNENADTAAKQATNENIITIPNIAKLDGKSFIKDKMETAWDNYWSVSVQNTNTGKHLKNIKDNTDYWPWTSIPDKRKMETVLARLRIGHCGLRAHMYRFGMTVLPLCECGLYETIEHYLIECALRVNERRPLEIYMQQQRANMSLKNILGGGDFNCIIQNVIASHVWKFIQDTGKSDTI
jgi:hypothetical protein